MADEWTDADLVTVLLAVCESVDTVKQGSVPHFTTQGWNLWLSGYRTVSNLPDHSRTRPVSALPPAVTLKLSS